MVTPYEQNDNMHEKFVRLVEYDYLNGNNKIPMGTSVLKCDYNKMVDAITASDNHITKKIWVIYEYHNVGAETYNVELIDKHLYTKYNEWYKIIHAFNWKKVIK